MTASWCAISEGCDYKLYWRGLTATPRLTRTSGIATATWRESLALRGISRGPGRCQKGGRQPVRRASAAEFVTACGYQRVDALTCGFLVRSTQLWAVNAKDGIPRQLDRRPAHMNRKRFW